MIWQIAGNRRMAQTLDRIAGPMIALQAKVYQPLLKDLVQKEADDREGSHRRIVDAICAANPSAARTAMQKHIIAFWQMWLKQASVNGDKGSPQAIDDAVLLLESLSSVFEAPPKKHDVM
jgi:DNA-binding GntR family transcriptional regulator